MAKLKTVNTAETFEADMMPTEAVDTVIALPEEMEDVYSASLKPVRDPGTYLAVVTGLKSKINNETRAIGVVVTYDLSAASDKMTAPIALDGYLWLGYLRDGKVTLVDDTGKLVPNYSLPQFIGCFYDAPPKGGIKAEELIGRMLKLKITHTKGMNADDERMYLKVNGYSAYIVNGVKGPPYGIRA